MQNLLVYVADKLKLDQNYPNLIHFELGKPIRAARLEAFLELNPQLQSLKSPMLCNPNELQRVNELLPNLQSVGIVYKTEEDALANGVIHFKNAKKFSLNLLRIEADNTANIQNTLSLIKFDHLQAFELMAGTNSMTVAFKKFLFDLIAQHSLLTNLEFEWFDLTADELMRLVKPMHHLESLKLSCTSSTNISEIQKFLSEALDVKKITIFTDINGPRKCHRFELPPQWKVIGEEPNDLVYHRILGKNE